METWVMRNGEPHPIAQESRTASLAEAIAISLTFCLCFGIVTFYSSRGPDGRPVEAQLGTIAVGAAYVAYGRRRRFTGPPVWWIAHLLAFQIVAACAASIPPVLEEMGGMITIWIACIILATCLIGGLREYRVFKSRKLMPKDQLRSA